jgi:hypothetical protein
MRLAGVAEVTVFALVRGSRAGGRGDTGTAAGAGYVPATRAPCEYGHIHSNDATTLFVSQRNNRHRKR